MALLDRIKQREALLASFWCLAELETRLFTFESFTKMMNVLYYHKKSYRKRIKPLFQMLD
jgi:hypothetical protein